MGLYRCPLVFHPWFSSIDFRAFQNKDILALLFCHMFIHGFLWSLVLVPPSCSSSNFINMQQKKVTHIEKKIQIQAQLFLASIITLLFCLCGEILEIICTCLFLFVRLFLLLCLTSPLFFSLIQEIFGFSTKLKSHLKKSAYVFVTIVEIIKAARKLKGCGQEQINRQLYVCMCVCIYISPLIKVMY